LNLFLEYSQTDECYVRVDCRLYQATNIQVLYYYFLFFFSRWIFLRNVLKPKIANVLHIITVALDWVKFCTSGYDLTVAQAIRNLVDYPNCACGQVESTSHFLISCKKFNDLRNELMYTINYPVTIDVKLLLKGSDTFHQISNFEFHELLFIFNLVCKIWPNRVPL
jgi:hypothetical protein